MQLINVSDVINKWIVSHLMHKSGINLTIHTLFPPTGQILNYGKEILKITANYETEILLFSEI